ncbi:TIGR02679 family protein [Ornithinibacillus halophilus]|uniref:TIGR02679 family protein n=2 Tax=Ornithinibacillus halophilus TaxID=930117 RepID=A0A1M5KFX9_9BACI|nr:TIGR02679 family protein [Ornithinibacillus halophilus]
MIDEALEYFNREFHQLFNLFKKKYESLGRVGGTVKLDGFKMEELEAVARFMGVTAGDLKLKGKLSLESFEKQLQTTKFASLTLKEILEAYFNEPLISKKQRKQMKDSQQEQYFNDLVLQFPDIAFWIDYIRLKNTDSYWIYRLLEESPKSFIGMVRVVNQAYVNLPNKFERLPMFSHRITRNPHAFDLNTNIGRLFIHLLAVDHTHTGEVIVPSNTEGINNLLLDYQILRDDITNYVTNVNLLAETENGIHPMWRAASDGHSVMNTPIRELVKVNRAYPNNGGKSIWIVENSGVFSSILDTQPKLPLLCTHG